MLPDTTSDHVNMTLQTVVCLKNQHSYLTVIITPWGQSYTNRYYYYNNTNVSVI